MLGRQPKDFDLATDAVPDTVETIMAKAGFRTLPTGKSFGVINVFTNKDEYEIATFRSDSSTGDGRLSELENFIAFITPKVSSEKLNEFKNKVMK